MADETTIKTSWLDRFFHIRSRGSTLGREISAGLGVSFLSVCGIFINIQLLASLSISGSYADANITQVAANGELYAQMYFISMLLAFGGSLLMGLVARLPLVQVSGLGLSSVLISLAGTGSGLTYSNLLVICFFSSLLYAALVSVPGLRALLLRAVPAPVRRALPAAVGLLMAFTAIQLSGLVTVGDSGLAVCGAGSVLEPVGDSVSTAGLVSFDSYSYATDKFHPLLLVSALAVLAAFVSWVLFRRGKRPYLNALLCGTALFLLGSICAVGINWETFNFSLDFLWGRLWMVGSEDAMHTHLSALLSNLKVGAIFTEGMDFSAYTANGGSPVLLFATGILTFLFTTFFDAQATLEAVSAETGLYDAGRPEEVGLALLCGAGMNVAAPLVGGAPLTIGQESCAGTGDGGRTGLTSVTAALVYLVSAFLWIVPFFFATATSYDIVFNLYGHYGTVMQLLFQTSFAVADGVMVILGLSMAARSLKGGWSGLAEGAALMATVAGTFFLSNLACGAALGTLAYLLAQAGGPEEGRATLPNLLWGAAALALLVLTALG